MNVLNYIYYLLMNVHSLICIIFADFYFIGRLTFLFYFGLINDLNKVN